jgi:hypothetical protein
LLGAIREKRARSAHRLPDFALSAARRPPGNSPSASFRPIAEIAASQNRRQDAGATKDGTERLPLHVRQGQAGSCKGPRLGVCSKMMRLRFVASVLVFVLLGADSGAAGICTAYCTSVASPESAGLPHHHMKSQPSRASAGQQIRGDSRERNVRDHRAMCAECPRESENSANSKPDCTGAAGVQGLTESAVSLAGSRQIERALVARDVGGPTLVCYRPQFAVFGASPRIKSGSASSLPLRI